MPAANPLDELAIQYGTDKSSRGHNYTEPYYSVFAPLRERKLKILEIGVSTGASLRMWEDFFPYSEIYGIEKRPSEIRYPARRGEIFAGDQTDRDFLERVVHETGDLDVIIDDGSHHPDHQLISLATLFPHLSEDGVYVIEDLACCFHPRYGPHAGLANPGSTIEYLKRLLDVLHADPGAGGVVGDPISGRIQAMHFYPQIAFLFKGATRDAGIRSGEEDLRARVDTSPLRNVRSIRARLRAAGFRLRKLARRTRKDLGRLVAGRLS